MHAYFPVFLLIALLALELSLYLFSGLQRFKQMRDMHGSSSRDDRLKREQQRQEREMAKFKQMYVLVINQNLFYLLPGSS